MSIGILRNPGRRESKSKQKQGNAEERAKSGDWGEVPPMSLFLLSQCPGFPRMVNWMNCVESRRGGPIDPSPLKALCNYFFFESVPNICTFSNQFSVIYLHGVQ